LKLVNRLRQGKLQVCNETIEAMRERKDKLHE
jgi:hypothetical protein